MTLEDRAVPAEVEGLLSPFPGLRPFEREEYELFFGREGQIEELILKLSKTHFLAVVGVSGSGKSSLVRAGLLPALYGGLMGKAGSGWKFAILRPGSDPLGNLARALTRPDALQFDDEETPDIQTEVNLRRSKRGLVESVQQARLGPHDSLLVLVDQFEELFRFTRISEDEEYANDAAAFVKRLLEAKDQKNIYVVLTMRSEYLGECARFSELPEAINEGQYLIPRMTREQSQLAITGPVEVCRARIAPGLVNQLLNDLGDSPNQLPVLQHALMRIWEKWSQDNDQSAELNLNHYQAIGGMTEALSRHADEAYAELADEHNRKIAEKLFKCLTEKGLDDKETRRPTQLNEICLVADASEKDVLTVIDVFRREGRSFVMPPQNVPIKTDSSIDISHESLINGWQRLKEWVDEEANSARIYRRLVEYAISSRDYKKGELRDPWLQETLDWRDKNSPNVAWASRHHKRFYHQVHPQSESNEDNANKDILDLEIFELAMDFLDTSKRVGERQRKKELRHTRQFAFVVALASIVILVLGLKLLQSSRRVYESSNKLSETTKTITRLNYRTNMNIAEKAAEERKFAAANRILSSFPDPNQEDLRGLDWYYLWRALHNELGTLRGHSAKVTSVAFSPDNNFIATASEDQTVRLWNADTRKPVTTLNGHQAAVLSVAFAPDSKTIATGSADGTVKLWNIAGEQSTILRDLFVDQKAVPVRSLAFEKSGNRLVLGSEDGSVRLCDTTMLPEKCWNSKFAEPKPEFRTSAGQWSRVYVSSVAFSPDGAAFVSGSADGTVTLWNTNTRQKIQLKPKDKEMQPGSPPGGRTEKPSNPVSVAFSPDGKTIAAGYQDGQIRLWDRESRVEKPFLNGRPTAGAVNTLAFADVHTLVSGNGDATLGLWDTEKGTALTFKGHSGEVFAVGISPDGKNVVTGSEDATARVWNLTAPQDSIKLPGRRAQDPLKEEGSVADTMSVAFSPKTGSAIIAIGTSDGRVNLWDISKNKSVDTLPGHTLPVRALAFSPDGNVIASGSADQTVRLWDIATRESKTLPGHKGGVTSVAFTPDGKTLASGSEDGTVKLWDTSTGRELKTLNGHSNKVWCVAFSFDGQFLASGSEDNTIKVWSVSSRELLKTLSKHSNGILSLAFSRDNRFLASGSDDNTARIWDVNLGFTPLATLTGQSRQKSAVLSVAFSPDSTRLITGYFDGSVKFWDTGTSSWDSAGEQELATLNRDVGEGQPIVHLWSLAISTDGKTIATGRDDFSVDVWQAATDEQVRMQR